MDRGDTSRETFEHQGHYGEPRWSLYGKRGWMDWYGSRMLDCGRWGVTMRCWKRSNENYWFRVTNCVLAARVTSVKSRLGPDLGESQPGDWGFIFGGQECGQSGIEFHQAMRGASQIEAVVVLSPLLMVELVLSAGVASPVCKAPVWSMPDSRF